MIVMEAVATQTILKLCCGMYIIVLLRGTNFKIFTQELSPFYVCVENYLIFYIIANEYSIIFVIATNRQHQRKASVNE